MCQVRARQAVGVRSPNGVAGAAAGAVEHRLAGGMGWRSDSRRGLAGSPGLIVRWRVGDDDQGHQRVRTAAELGALGAVFARLVGLYAQDIAAAGDHVELAVQPRDPQAMDDVGRLQFQRHGPTGGDMDLVGVLEGLAAGRVEIADPPPPHLAGDANAQFSGAGRLAQAMGQRKAPDQQGAQQHDGKGDPGDPDETLAAQAFAPSPWREEREGQGDDHDRQHGGGHGQQAPGQAVQRRGEGTGRVQRRRRPALQALVSGRRVSLHRVNKGRPRRRGLGRRSSRRRAWRCRGPWPVRCEARRSEPLAGWGSVRRSSTGPEGCPATRRPRR
ncbi:conserved hypothetical protein, partial [Ricinus communis]